MPTFNDDSRDFKYYTGRGRPEIPSVTSSGRRKRKIIFELTFFQGFVLTIVMGLGFVWMFFLGVVMERNVWNRGKHLDTWQKIALVLGFGSYEEDKKSTKDTLESSPKPQDIQLNLDYHQKLLTPSPFTIVESPSGATTTVIVKKKPTHATPTAPPVVSPAAPTTETTSSHFLEAEKEKDQQKADTSSSTIATGEKYTVLVASFKSGDNATKLEQMLRSKGYIVFREETKISNETWYRITVGNFDSKDTAMKFVAMFNQKEKLKGVIIRR